ncbi:peptidoglycan-binding protein [Streptomyces sp. NPDC002467]|uniref:peptidoglycan-binding domain-containing protein n=1 Tax=Streptomyces sp. NPDC002467 TaxID=3364647 RepID=UPI00369839B9
MSHDTDEHGASPDERHFAYPYVPQPTVWPSGPPTHAWPHTDPASHQDQDPASGQDPAPYAAAPVPVPAPDRGTDFGRAPEEIPPAGRRRERRGVDPVVIAVFTLLGLGAAGGLFLMLTGPEDPKPPRAKAPTELTVPGLPGRMPGSGAEPTESPEPTGPTRSPSPSPSAPRSSGPPTTQAPDPTPSASPSTAKAGVPAATLRMGDKGPQVRALQEFLLGQGFTYVSVTGVYDGQTKRGVSQLQRDRDIKGDPQGVYGPATQAALD